MIDLLRKFRKKISAIGFSVDVNLLIDLCNYKEKNNRKTIAIKR